jgi:hypothetical protein
VAWQKYNRYLTEFIRNLRNIAWITGVSVNIRHYHNRKSDSGVTDESR